MGKGLGDPALLGQFNWLHRSCVADNPVLVAAAARQTGCPPRRAVEVQGEGGTVRLRYVGGGGSVFEVRVTRKCTRDSVLS